jgi:hypothetical protein
MYVVGRMTPILLKKIIQDNKKEVNALEAPESQYNPETTNGI